MAIYHKGNIYGKNSLRDGGRGWDSNHERINRTQHTLNTSAHEATNIKYGMDDRLEKEFTFGYALGFNQMLAAKGRIVAVDPYLKIFDADTQKEDNALTLANGGVDVIFGDQTRNGVLIKEWKELPLGDEQIVGPLDNGTVVVGTIVNNEFVEDETQPVGTIRPANTPIGILIRNEYTRGYNALNGISPGAVNTDCMTELPYFKEEDKAKCSPWGSAYGNLKPGDLVKSDTTGRFVLSSLSQPTWLKTASPMEIELERQQVIGQVYEVREELVPMGAAKYAQWALSDIMQFDEFNPDLKRKTNRKGEDNIESTPYPANGKAPFGFDSTVLGEHDLHMLGLGDDGSSRKAYNQRMQHRYRFDFGIPGLTDGYNAHVEVHAPKAVGTILKDATGVTHTFRTLDTNVEVDSITVRNGANGTITTLTSSLVGELIAELNLKLVYLNELQGVVQFEVPTTNGPSADIDLQIGYSKRGKAGVPTHLDWDGCAGTVKILLQK